jgi:hypothetical protein
VAAGVGAWRARLPSAVAIVTLVLFSLVPHKEYRFIQPVVQVLTIVVGIGMAELIDKVRSWRPGAYPFAVAGGFAALAALSLATLLSPNTRALWRQNAGTLWALRQINQDPQSCGVALFPPADWYRAFRSQLRDDVPVFTPAASQPGAYNRALAFGGIKPDGGYALMGCRGDEAACLWRRPGSCNPALGSPLTASSTSETQSVLRRLGLES